MDVLYYAIPDERDRHARKDVIIVFLLLIADISSILAGVSRHFFTYTPLINPRDQKRIRLNTPTTQVIRSTRADPETASTNLQNHLDTSRLSGTAPLACQSRRKQISPHNLRSPPRGQSSPVYLRTHT